MIGDLPANHIILASELEDGVVLQVESSIFLIKKKYVINMFFLKNFNG
jgi:hypothetical protein